MIVELRELQTANYNDFPVITSILSTGINKKKVGLTPEICQLRSAVKTRMRKYGEYYHFGEEGEGEVRM